MYTRAFLFHRHCKIPPCRRLRVNCWFQKAATCFCHFWSLFTSCTEQTWPKELPEEFTAFLEEQDRRTTFKKYALELATNQTVFASWEVKHLVPQAWKPTKDPLWTRMHLELGGTTSYPWVSNPSQLRHTITEYVADSFKQEHAK